MAKDNTWSQLKPSASPSVETNDGLSNLRGEDAFQTRATSSAFPTGDMALMHPHNPCQNLHNTSSSCFEDPNDESSLSDIFQFSNLDKIIEPFDWDKDDYNVAQCRVDVDSVTPDPGPVMGTAGMYRIYSQANPLHANNMDNRTTPLHHPPSEGNLIGVGGGINNALQNSMENLRNTHDSVINCSPLTRSAYLQDSPSANKRRCLHDDSNTSLSLDLFGTELNCRNDLTPQPAEDLMRCGKGQQVGFQIPNEGDAQKNKDGNETCGRVLSRSSAEELDGISLTLGRGDSAMVLENAVLSSSSSHKAGGNSLSQASAYNQDDRKKNILRSYPSSGGFVSSSINTLYEPPVVHSDTAVSHNATSRIRPIPSSILQSQLASNDQQYFIARNSNLGSIGSQNVGTAHINCSYSSSAGFPLSHDPTHNPTVGNSSRQHQMTHIPPLLSQPFQGIAQTAYDAEQRDAMLADSSLSTAPTRMNLPMGNPGILAMPMANSPGYPQCQGTPRVYNQTIQHPAQQWQMAQSPSLLSQPFCFTAIDSAQRGLMLRNRRLSTAPTQMNSPLVNQGIWSMNNPQGYQAWLRALLQRNENAPHFYQQHRMTPSPSSLSQQLHTTAERTLDEVRRDTMLTNQTLLTVSSPVISLEGTPGDSTSPVGNQPGNCGQPQADNQVEPQSIVSIPLSTDKARTAKGHGRTQVSSTRRGGVRTRGGKISSTATTCVRHPVTQRQIPRLRSPLNQSSLVSPLRPIQSYPNQESEAIACGHIVSQTSPSLLSSRKAALPRYQQSPVAHIKCKDKDEEHQLLGQKCYICKRDLSYPPEGPIVRPPIPVTSAVLPCGHTFHAHCLQQITPEIDCTDPPCIPCALGED